MKKAFRLTGLVLAFIIMLSAVSVSVVPASSIYSFPIVIQNDSKWTGSANTYGSGTLRDTGCGIFSLVNAVGCLTGNAMDVNEVAAWAYSIGAFNKGGADGTYRLELYPKVEAKFGSRYGFTLDCNGTSGWWQGSNSTLLKNHLKNGGVAIGHVPGHFIAIVEYDASKSACYHIYDSYPTNSRGTFPGDVWVTESHLATGSLKLDWFCLLSLDENSIPAPSISVSKTVDYNTALPVSWGAVTNALSYKYKVERYDGEMSGTDPVTIVAETATTGTSFSIPAQSTGKYYKITVTAVGESDSRSATAVVMVGPEAAYPEGVQYIPVKEINGTVVISNSCILTYDFTTGMALTYWRGFLLTPNADGTYTVAEVYEHGVPKTINMSSNNFMFVIHEGFEGYALAEKIVEGDNITLCGLYVDGITVRGDGYILVNGGVPLGDTYTVTFVDWDGTTLDTQTVEHGFAATAPAAPTREGYTFTGWDTDFSSITADTTVTAMYEKALVLGDVNGDGSVDNLDAAMILKYDAGIISDDAIVLKAADVNGDGSVDNLDAAWILRYDAGLISKF